MPRKPKTVAREDALRAYMNLETIQKLDAEFRKSKTTMRSLTYVVRNKDMLRPGAVLGLKARKRRSRALILALVALNIVLSALTLNRSINDYRPLKRVWSAAVLIVPILAWWYGKLESNIELDEHIAETLRGKRIEVVGDLNTRLWRDVTFGALVALTGVNVVRLVYVFASKLDRGQPEDGNKVRVALLLETVVSLGLGAIVGLAMTSNQVDEEGMVEWESLAAEYGARRNELLEAMGRNWPRYVLRRPTPSAVRADLESGMLKLSK